MLSMMADHYAGVREHTERVSCEHCGVRHLTVVYPMALCSYHGGHATVPQGLRQMCVS